MKSLENNDGNMPINKIFQVNLASNPNSTVIKINKTKIRVLLDSGADISLLHERVYRSIKGLPPLKKTQVLIQSVCGDSMQVSGSVNLQFNIGNETLEQTFYIVPDMNRNCILGRDCLIKHGVRMHWDVLGFSVGKSFFPIEQDIHISSLVCVASQVILKPRSVTYLTAKTKVSNDKSLCQIVTTDQASISQDPGLILHEGVVKIKGSSKFPLLITNTTNKTYKLKRGCVLGKAESVAECNLIKGKNISFNSETKLSNKDIQSKIDQLKSKLTVPAEQRPKIEAIVETNVDLFAEKDTELGKTNTLEMNIDTQGHPPIAKKPYRTPLTKRAIADKAIDDMLQAKVIKPSKSPWSFPIVIVDKKTVQVASVWTIVH